jgi:hypothetical protein
LKLNGSGPRALNSLEDAQRRAQVFDIPVLRFPDELRSCETLWPPEMAGIRTSHAKEALLG